MLIVSTRSPRHKPVLSAIRNALTLHDEPEAWRGLETTIKVCLTPDERARLLSSAAEAIEVDLLLKVFEAVIPTRLVGVPLPVFVEIEDDARWWADLASLPELRAWLLACFTRLPASEQIAFLDAAKGSTTP